MILTRKPLTLLALFPLVLALPALPACHARGPKFQKVELYDPDYALVYVYRKNAPPRFRDAEIPLLFLDDHKVSSLKTNGYTWFKAPPGEHVIALKDTILGMPSHDLISHKLSVEPNKVYYVQYSVWQCGSLFPEVCRDISIAGEEFALNELKTHRYQESEYRPDRN